MRLGNTLILVGVAVVAVGLVVRFVPGLFSWFGNLPGDIDHRGENTRVFIPITSMLVVSLVATLVLNLLARFFSDR